MATLSGLLQIFIICFMVTTVVSQQPVVSVDAIEDGGTFSVTCDASRMTNLASSVNNVYLLAIRRQTSQNAYNVLLAHYRAFGSTPQLQNIPVGRQWTVNFTGINGGINNRNTMKIVILVSDAKCNDAGIYTCEVMYEGSYGASFTVLRTQNVTSKSAVENITLNANKYSPMSGRPDFSEYQEGDTVTLTCSIDGPEELEVQWKQGRDDNFNGFTIWDYPYTNDITTFDPTLITNSTCNQYEHRSVLNLRSLSQDNDQVMYLCVVMKNDQIGAAEVASANITIGVTQNPRTTISPTAGNGLLLVTVDADSVSIPEDGVTDIIALTLNRRTTQDQDYQFVAQYKAYSNKPEVKNIPPGRDWIVTFSGANGGTNNRSTMKMEFVIRDAQSSDAGVYQWIVRYTRPQDGADVDVAVTQVLVPAINGGCQP